MFYNNPKWVCTYDFVIYIIISVRSSVSVPMRSVRSARNIRVRFFSRPCSAPSADTSQMEASARRIFSAAHLRRSKSDCTVSAEQQLDPFLSLFSAFHFSFSQGIWWSRKSEKSVKQWFIDSSNGMYRAWAGVSAFGGATTLLLRRPPQPPSAIKREPRIECIHYIQMNILIKKLRK